MVEMMRAFVVDKTESGFSRALQDRPVPVPQAGEALVRVEWSSVNYKDALAASEDGKVARGYPRVPGIDLAGTVAVAGDGGPAAGSRVLAHGRDLGVSRDGGFEEFCAVPVDWLIPLPDSMETRTAMIAGTAGFTAAESVLELIESGLTPAAGPVLVTGATGGVGSFAVALLAGAGFEVTASTSRTQREEWLRGLGAAEVMPRFDAPAKPLERETWAGVVDTVGGSTLAAVLATANYGSTVTACGNTGGGDLNSSVFPFILRGVRLVGIDSVNCAHDYRTRVWSWLASAVPANAWSALAGREAPLDSVGEALDEVRAGSAIGRTLVALP